MDKVLIGVVIVILVASGFYAFNCHDAILFKYCVFR